jgi:hypothetical protein
MAWLGTWAHRIEITIPDTNIDGNLTNFPVLIYLSTSSGTGAADVSAVFDELTSDANRKKIAITTSNGTTECYVEIEKWVDADEEAWLWVKIPSILATGGATLYLYYDSTESDNTTYIGDTTDAVTHNVWDEYFVGVWHMAQDPDGDGSGAIKDSTSYGNDGTPDGTMLTADLVSGPIGDAIVFDGVDDWIDFGILTILWHETTYTLEAFINMGVFGASDSIVRAWGGGGQQAFALILDATDNGEFWMMNEDASPTPALKGVTTDCSITAATPVYLAGAWAGGNTLALYENGAAKTVSYPGGQSAPGEIPWVNEHLGIAGKYDGGTPADFFDGIIDEVRISNVARTADWIKATNYSNRDTLASFGAEEDYTGSGYTIEMDGGTYALTGTALEFIRNYQIGMGVGSYALTGTAISFKKVATMIMGSGSYLLTGSDVTLSIIAILLTLNSIIEQETTLDSDFNQEKTLASLIEQETTMDSKLIKGQE